MFQVIKLALGNQSKCIISEFTSYLLYSERNLLLNGPTPASFCSFQTQILEKKLASVGFELGSSE